MDFMKWLNSLDELLYEVMSWLVFYPLTLWRSLVRPRAMMDYADRQLNLLEAEQYADALSPPLFLALTLALAHVAATALGEVDAVVASHRGLADLIDDDTSALVFRLLLFSVFPLMTAVRLVRLQGQALTRETLRLPFYAQCYPASVFALVFNGGVIAIRLADVRVQVAGLALMAVAVAWYLMVETRWFAAQTHSGRWSAFGSALRAFIEGFALLVATGLLFAR